MIELTFLRGTDDNKTSASKECDVCHYWYFSNYSLKFQPNIFNRCQSSLMMSINLSDIAVLNIKGSDYRCLLLLLLSVVYYYLH